MNSLNIFLFALIFVFTNAMSQTVIRKIKPSDTDPLIATFNTDSNYVYININKTQKNILLVHLPGSFGEPKRATLFGTLAADLGFHSIGLMYPNAPTVGSFCTNSSNANCFEDVRREIIEGVDYSSQINIGYNESILNRTQKLLAYLKNNFPTENWGQYLDESGKIIFNKVIFSGHSQGGGHAALIAKYYPLKRAICFSSPKDWRNATDAPPLWLSSGNWQTPASSIYAFNHVLDEHTNHQLEIWDSLGLNQFGKPVNVDSNSSPYNNTRQLTTAFAVPSGDDHASTIQDNKTPKMDGKPAFEPVWTYMLTDNMATNIISDFFDSKADLQIYPNPANSEITIVFENKNIFTVNIYDSMGKQLITKKAEDDRITLEISSLSSGLYFIEAISPHRKCTAKSVKN